MRRTASRPLPSGVLQPAEALWFGVSLSVGGAVDLWIVAGWLASFLGAITCLSYLLAVHTAEESVQCGRHLSAQFPGAVPPMIGWAAATRHLDGGAWLLFLILFFWQFPHFNAIAWMYREDYARAGIRMLSVGDVDGSRTFRQISDLCGDAGGRSACCHRCLRMTGMLYFFGALAGGHGAGTSLCLGGVQQEQCPREVADARTGAAHSNTAGADGVRQDRPITTGCIAKSASI
jgi:protoheme IX farnesyltransferase